jgi:FAD/FMN-containing dehydrogenase
MSISPSEISSVHAHLPGSTGYAASIASFNVLPVIAPSLAVTARTTAEVIAAVKSARTQSVGLSIMTTGHASGGMAQLDGTLLVRPEFDLPVTVDAETRIATVPAGARWGDVVEVAATHGLAAMHGSSATVGVIGYLLRGGLSFYGRRNGVASNSLRSVSLVTADGDLVKADRTTEPDLFWAIRGGGGGFGVVVEVEIELFPMWQVFTGFTAWDARDAAVIAPLWRRWTESAPDDVTTSLRLMNLPPLPQIPEVLRNGQILVLDGAVSIETPAHLVAGLEMAEALLAPLRSVAEPIMDTWHAGSPTDLPATHMDPPDPMPYLADHFLVDGFDDAAVDGWLASAGMGSGSVLTSAELRQLGGSFAEERGDGGALNRIEGQFAAFNVGVPVGPATPPLVLEQQLRIRESLANYDTGFTAPTFVEAVDAPHRALPAHVQERAERIRRRFDPANAFERDVVRATIK